MPERLASLPATLRVHVREIRSRLCRCGLCSSCACRLDLANIHRHAHHSSRGRWSCGATWSDMKRTCATCHEYSCHAPFVSSNSMVVVTNGGHSRSGRHSSPRAPFCTVLGADWGRRLECSSRVRARWRAEAGMRRLFGPIPRSWRQTVAIFAHGSLSHFCARLSLSLSRVLCPPASLSIMPLTPPCH